ncbi:MAG: FecR domain-containing protein [Pseudomonadota bacterium]
MKPGQLKLLSALLACLLFVPRVNAVDWIYTARPGDSFWNIAETHLTSVGLWKRLQSYNRVQNPTELRPGTRVKIPVHWLRERPASAVLAESSGEVRIATKRNAKSRAGAQGDQLEAGYFVSTGQDGSAIVELANGSRVRIGPNAELELNQLSAFGKSGMVDTSLRLHRGRIESDVAPALGPKSRFEIHTPSATAAVRGTIFRVGASDTSTLTEVNEGGVAVSGSDRTQNVSEGFGTVTKQGEPPQPPRRLLPAPDLSDNPDVQRVLALDFNWPPIPGAQNYRAQLYNAAQTALLTEKVTDRPGASLTAPPDGNYLIRVRALDEDGLEGHDADRRFEVDARPPPPTLVEPRNALKAHEGPLRIWWTAPEGAANYILQIADREDFSNIVLEPEPTSATEYVVKELPPPGTYFWRLASRDSSGEVGPFSESRGFEILRVPEAVAAKDPVVGNDDVILGWSPNADAASYRFILAEDEAFQRVVTETSTTDQQVTLPKPNMGTYYFRIQAISGEGVAGPPGTINRLEVPFQFHPAMLSLALPLLLLL